ncbi:hypothetical protein [Streptomyces erythrochromogenes]
MDPVGPVGAGPRVGAGGRPGGTDRVNDDAVMLIARPRAPRTTG